jgi:hypothetical protein
MTPTAACRSGRVASKAAAPIEVRTSRPSADRVQGQQGYCRHSKDYHSKDHEQTQAARLARQLIAQACRSPRQPQVPRLKLVLAGR